MERPLCFYLFFLEWTMLTYMVVSEVGLKFSKSLQRIETQELERNS